MISLALDGFPIYALLDKEENVPTDLDQCRGQYDDVRGYHYHVAEPGTNSFIDCFTGETGCKFEGKGEGEICDATKVEERRGGPGGGPGGLERLIQTDSYQKLFTTIKYAAS